MKSASSLYHIYQHGGTFRSAILVDLFGVLNWPEDGTFDARLQIMDGVYKGLYQMGVSAEKIETHRRANTLDQLIHASYRQRSSGYYQQFCDQGIVIGRTHLL